MMRLGFCRCKRGDLNNGRFPAEILPNCHDVVGAVLLGLYGEGCPPIFHVNEDPFAVAKHQAIPQAPPGVGLQLTACIRPK